MNLTRRADALKQWTGDVSAGAGVTSGAASTVTPQVTARLGLGYGLTAELSASGSATDLGKARPGAGLKWTFLGASPTSPLSLAAMALYRPEGFVEPEGEVEFHLIGSYRAGRGEVNVNAVAGGDPDGKEQDVEGKVGAGYWVTSHLFVGGEAQSRASLGTKIEGRAQEHIAGPTVQYRAGNFLLGGLIGGGMLKMYKDSAFEAGAYGAARIGYRF